MNDRTRALALMSGGLDSILAARLLMDQDIEVTGLTFVSPFFGPEKGKSAARTLGIPLRIVDISDRFMLMLKTPRYGFGNNMNPCIDCHTLMVRISGEIMVDEGFDVIATGEVLGERPMSQNRQSLDNVARNSGFADYLLRPLSARLLAETRPEREGKIDRSRLLAISGRSRKPQISLAKHYGIIEYPQPAGGCLLTDPHYAGRLSELLQVTPTPDRAEIDVLAFGRHFRTASGLKIVVSRNADEGDRVVDARRPGDMVVSLEPLMGPIALIQGTPNEEDIRLAAGLCRYYSRYRHQAIAARGDAGETYTSIDAPFLVDDDFRQLLIDKRGRT